ncbi:hypothetical protein Tco_0461015 [Tanacetum coccineum]
MRLPASCNRCVKLSADVLYKMYRPSGVCGLCSSDILLSADLVSTKGSHRTRSRTWLNLNLVSRRPAESSVPKDNCDSFFDYRHRKSARLTPTDPVPSAENS